MISAQRFVEQWRQQHAFEVMTIEGLAQMLVAYASQFTNDEATIYARAWDEVSNEVMAKVEAYEGLRDKVVALPAYYTDAGDGVVRADVLALLGGSDG
jgi:hypothetical protein